MLSVLIPVYNKSVETLVSDLHKQLKQLDIDFEVLILDDASTNKEHQASNKTLNTLEKTHYKQLEQNIGRSAIRNKLAQTARFEWLLFMDCNTGVSQPDFIKNFITNISNTDLIFGGVCYKKPTSSKYSLRYKYGFLRESKPLSIRKQKPYLNFTTKCFLIKKTVFELMSFNETISTYGYEDSIFGFDLRNHHFKIKHIDNPILHKDIDDNLTFVNKTNSSLKNLIEFETLFTDDDFKLLKYYKFLKKTKLIYPLGYLTKCFKNIIIRIVSLNNTPLFIFDIYRVLTLCELFINKKS